MAATAAHEAASVLASLSSTDIRTSDQTVTAAHEAVSAGAHSLAIQSGGDDHRADVASVVLEESVARAAAATEGVKPVRRRPRSSPIKRARRSGAAPADVVVEPTEPSSGPAAPAPGGRRRPQRRSAAAASSALRAATGARRSKRETAPKPLSKDKKEAAAPKAALVVRDGSSIDSQRSEYRRELLGQLPLLARLTPSMSDQLCKIKRQLYVKYYQEQAAAATLAGREREAKKMQAKIREVPTYKVLACSEHHTKFTAKHMMNHDCLICTRELKFGEQPHRYCHLCLRPENSVDLPLPVRDGGRCPRCLVNLLRSDETAAVKLFMLSADSWDELDDDGGVDSGAHAEDYNDGVAQVPRSDTMRSDVSLPVSVVSEGGLDSEFGTGPIQRIDERALGKRRRPSIVAQRRGGRSAGRPSRAYAGNRAGMVRRRSAAFADNGDDYGSDEGGEAMAHRVDAVLRGNGEPVPKVPRISSVASQSSMTSQLPPSGSVGAPPLVSGDGSTAEGSKLGGMFSAGPRSRTLRHAGDQSGGAGAGAGVSLARSNSSLTVALSFHGRRGRAPSVEPQSQGQEGTPARVESLGVPRLPSTAGSVAEGTAHDAFRAETDDSVPRKVGKRATSVIPSRSNTAGSEVTAAERLLLGSQGSVLFADEG